ncbi:MAG: TolC family protein [Cyclobacteriaceae bacterium]|nr:TolC family protein [Cyclobacteriaceae bacterium]MCK5469174.1 TolC family protein [Cyclobacteriaceae bacterium]
MNKIKFLAFAVSLFFSANINAQDSQISGRVFTLKEIINIARQQSIASKQAETTRENRFWQFQSYRSNYKPQLVLDGTIPGFNRSFDEVRQEDGSYEFLPVSINNSEINLRLRQPIGATGTQLFLNSNITRFDNFLDTDAEDPYHLYQGNPLEIGIIQPLFQYNRLKWDKRIEPLRYEESQREYIESLEEISVFTTRRFFDLMLSQINLEIAEKNVANNDTIFKIAQGRYNLGKIAENELLQLELQLMNSRQQVAQSKLDIAIRSLRLRTWAGLTDIENLQLFLPEEIPLFIVDEEVALVHAKANRSETISFERRKLEADADIAQAKGDTGPQADLFARFGLTNRTDRNASVGDLYKNPENQQIVQMGFEIPIMDWGRRKSRVKTAEANQKFVQYTVDQDIINFDEEVLTQVRQFEMLKEQVRITRVADDIAQRRYNITKNRYLIGKIAITDMNIALTEKDEAKSRYIQSLEDYWLSYFMLRQLTLYDFENGFQIISDEL